MSRPFRISVGRSRLSPTITRKTVSWLTLAKRLMKFELIDISYDDYLKLNRETQSNLKDVGYFIGGQFNSKLRHLDKMQFRSCITLDIDHIDSWDVEEIQYKYGAYDYVAHSTLKHCEISPRLRLVFPLKKDIPVEQYEPLARMIASQLGMDCFDDTTFQPARIMFWPAVTSDGEIYKLHNKGSSFIDPEKWLKWYADWTDFAEWPHSSRVKAIRPSTLKAEDPLTKQGIIGAFNRTFDIHAAIQRFELPYEQTEHDNRYRPYGASGPSGAVVYDEVFLYSHHESDVVGQQNVNAWDLVRLHRFGDKDHGTSEDTPVMQWPSSKLMAALALGIPEVEKELRTPASELSEIGPDGSTKTRSTSEGSDAPEPTDLTFASLLDEISEINPKAKNIHELCKNRVQRIAAAKLDDIDNSILAAALREKYPVKPPKSAIERDIKTTGKRLTAQLSDGEGGITDIEQDLISAMLTEHYHDGRTIKRIGNRFWTYERGLWALHNSEAVKGKLIKTLTRLRKERPEDVLQLVAAVGETKTSTLMRALDDMMCAQLAELEDRDDPLGLMRTYPLPIINCQNCELWFDIEGNLEQRKHNPDNFFTIRIDTKYNPKAKCPEWDRFMHMLFGASSDCEDMTRHLEELGGYIIQFSRWLKTWVLFHGSKDTGKSTIAEVLKALLGNSFIGMELSAFGGSKSAFVEQGLIGKLALVDDDYDKASALPDGFIKKISEEKSMTTQIKYGDNLQFVSRSLPMVLSNHWPISRDVSDAFRERALVFPFVYKIAGAHRSDERRNLMMQELPGILNKFIAGLVRLRERGDWDVPLDCFDAHQEWEIKSNPARLFVAECIEHGTTRGDHITSTRMWDAYVQWSRQQRSTDASMRGLSKAEFFERMDAILGERVKRDGYPGWSGVHFSLGIREEMDELEDF